MDLNITTVRYERVRNLGNYESKRLTADVTVSDGQDPTEVAQALIAWVDEQLGLDKVDNDRF
jgi:hypothetical protein